MENEENEVIDEITTIRIRKELKDRFRTQKRHPREIDEDFLEYLMDVYDEIKEKRRTKQKDL